MGAFTLNTMGCSFQILAAAALVVSFIPILSWTALIIALPLSLLGLFSATNMSRKNNAQSADRLAFWTSIALAVTILARVFIFS